MNVWEGLEVAIIGGDARESEMAMIARDHGALVRRYGNPEPADGTNIRHCASLQEILSGARVAILPVPLMAMDGSIYAPHAPAPIHLIEHDLRLMAAKAHIVLGRSDDNLKAAAAAAGVTLHEYESDTDLMLRRAPAVAEGAIRVAIELSPFTIHRTDIAVTGFGRTASVLVDKLLALQANVHVFARRPEARAAAYALGAGSHSFEDAATVFPSIQILFNTVPARILTERELANLPPTALVVDLAAPPGGVDLDAAARLHLRNFWARGLGASAPATVARSQWIGVDRAVSGALNG